MSQLSLFAVASVVSMGLSFIASLLREPVVNRSPKLNDIDSMDSAYGKPIQRGWGTTKRSGNVIWSNKRTITKHENSIGKGIGGGATSITYTYSQSFCVAFGQGPIGGYLRVWADTKLIYDTRPNANVTKRQDVFTMYLGTESQDPDPLMESIIGEGEVPGYRGMPYIVFDELQLEDFANRMPFITAEVTDVLDTTTDVSTTSYEASGLGGGVSTIRDIRVVKDTGTYLAVSDDGLAKVHTAGDKLIANGYPFGSWDIAEWDFTPDGTVWVLDIATDPARILRLSSSDLDLKQTLQLAQTALTIAGDAQKWQRLTIAWSQGDELPNLGVITASGLRHPTLYPGNANPWTFIAIYREDQQSNDHPEEPPLPIFIGTHYLENLEPIPASVFAQIVGNEVWIALEGGKLARLKPNEGATAIVDLSASLGGEITALHRHELTLVMLCDDERIYSYDTEAGTLSVGLSAGQHSRTRYPLSSGTRIWCQNGSDWRHFEVDIDSMSILRTINDPRIQNLTDSYDPVTDALYQPCVQVSSLAISGPDSVTRPGGYQFSAIGNIGPVTWDIDGTGASIDQDGYVTLDGSSCGSFTITATDSCGASSEYASRVVNSGRWVDVPVCGDISYNQPCVGIYAADLVTGKCWFRCFYNCVRNDLGLCGGANNCSAAPDCQSIGCGGYDCCTQWCQTGVYEWQC